MPELKDLFGDTLEHPVTTGYTSEAQGLILLFNNILKIAIFAAGIFGLINLIVAGIGYIGSSGNPELIKKTSSRIWMSLLGLVIIASAIVLAGLTGLIFFGDATAILSPSIPEP